MKNSIYKVEMADLFNVLIIISIGDSQEDIDKLIFGLKSISE